MNNAERIGIIEEFGPAMEFQYLNWIFQELGYGTTSLVVCHMGYSSPSAASYLLKAGIPTICVSRGLESIEEEMQSSYEAVDTLRIAVHMSRAVAIIYSDEWHKRDFPLSYPFFKSAHRFETAPAAQRFIGNMKRRY